MILNKKIILGMIFVSFMLISNISMAHSSQVQVNPRPVTLSGPRGDVPLFDWLRSSFVPIIFGMKSANFTSGDVLYSEFSTNDLYTRTLDPHFSNSSRTFNLTSFKQNLSDFLVNPNALFPSWLMKLLHDLNSEIGDSNQLKISKFTRFLPTKVVNQNSHFVMILWDPDKSVINTIAQIQNNQTPTQPFTGDEVLTSVRMDRIVDNVFGEYIEKSNMLYENGSIARKMVQFGNVLNDYPLLGKRLVKALNLSDIIDLRNYAGSPDGVDKTVLQKDAIKNVNLGFTVSQLQINNLTLAKVGNNIHVNKFDATLVEHNALGLTVFNDTNNNGIMDLQMKKIESDRPGLNQTVLPSGSEEALYRVDFRNAESHSYIPLTKTVDKDELSFEFSASNISVDLNPITRNLDETLFTNASDLHQTIDEYGFKFHFSPNATSSEADLKFDFLLGKWSNRTVLNGLSLNNMIVTGISDFSGRNRVMTLTPDDKANLNPDETAQRARKFSIRAGQAPIAEVDLDQKPYVVAETTDEVAYGQTLPLLFVDLLFGKITSQGDVLHTIGGKVSSTRYLYSLSYPVFGGESITHDPTFAMVAGTSFDTSSTSTGSDTSDTNPSDNGVFGFEFITFLAIPLVAIIRKKK